MAKTNYLYKGPINTVDGTTLHNGRTYLLSDDQAQVKTLVANGFLTPVPVTPATVPPKAVRKETATDAS